MKIVGKPTRNKKTDEIECTITISDTDIYGILSAVMYYKERHQDDPDEITMRRLWDVEVELADIKDILRHSNV